MINSIKQIFILVIYITALGNINAYHSFDGIGNNILNPLWGSTKYPLQRFQVKAAEGYGNGSTLSGTLRPTARDISQKLSLPSNRHKIRNYRYATDMLTYIGQFFDHDIDLVKGNTIGETMDIRIPEGDRYFDPEGISTDDNPQYMTLARSDYILDVNSERQQINHITAYIDGSVVYGETAERAYKLRSHRDGRMLTYDSNMLPYASSQLEIDMAADSGKEEPVLAAGDFRGNVNPPILALQTLFLREHNRLAKELLDANPTWDDEKIYYEARKKNVAYLQSICFYEYMPMLGIQLEPYNGYKSNIDASVDNFFSTVSYRYGHSEVGDIIYRLDDNGNEISQGHIPLFEAYFYPSYALNAGIDPILRGMSWRHQMEVDTYFSNSISNFLFGDPGNGGTDLTARNIERGRDHGIPDYNTCRAEMNLPKKKTFDEITNDMYLALKLEEVYGSIDEIDAYIGGLAENHVNESNLGELFYSSMKEQFMRLRDGDRYYFENTDNGFFTESEIAEIRATGLRDIILRNTEIKNIPENVYFKLPGDTWPRSTA